MRPRRRRSLRPRRADGWAREREIERIAREEAPGWRERVFAYLFDPSWSVRDEASKWLLGEPELNRAEHAHVLRDREWAVRYNAPSERLADPEVETVPEWVPDLFAAALDRERNAIVARQILLLLARRAPDRFPQNLPNRIREDHGYARAGFGLGLLRIEPTRGWSVLRSMLERDEWSRGTIFALNVLIGEEATTRDLQAEGARAYIQSLPVWLDMETDYPYSRNGAQWLVEKLRELAEAQALSGSSVHRSFTS